MPGRDHFRAHGRRQVRLEAVAHHAGYEARVLVVDLSLAGAGLEISRPLAPGSRVRLAIIAPAFWDPLEIEATVAWLSHVDGALQAGVRFRHASEQALGGLFELLGP